MKLFLYEKKSNIYSEKKLNISNKNILINSHNELLTIDNIKNIENIFLNYNVIDTKKIYLYYFLNKNIYINYDINKYQEKSIINNPIFAYIFNFNNFNIISKINKINKQVDIINDICHIDVNSIIKYYDMLDDNYTNILNIIIDKIKLIWHNFLIINIYNLPKIIKNNNDSISNFYNSIMKNFGKIKECLPVNNAKKFSKSISRDIKYVKNSKHFFSSNNRQPLHNDYAYYPKEISPDWLLLYCLIPSEFGGYTSLVTVKYLKIILHKYDNELYKKIINKSINYVYKDINDSEIIVKKNILSSNDISNWNYFQIKKELNNENDINIVDKYFNFLEKKITEGNIYTINKKWNKGDGILFNDHLVLHQRTSFLGERWLKDLAIKDYNLELQ